MSTKNPKKQSRTPNQTSKVRRKKVSITWGDVLGIAPSRVIKRNGSKKSGNLDPLRRKLRFEPLEARLALSADPITLSVPEPPSDLEFGLVYFEDDMSMGKDQGGDVFQINWTGGADGTKLAEIRINLDKNGNGKRDPGEGFFDTTGHNGGVYGSYPFHFISKENVGSYSIEVEDGGQLLVIKFTDFLVDGKFMFSIDVDEWGVKSNGDSNPNAILEGAEIEGSLFTCVFEHPNYDTAVATVELVDKFDDPASVGLNLPNDGYNSSPSKEIQTAAGIGSFAQVPKKGSLSGFVYEDVNNSGIKDANEKGIADVALSLWVWNGNRYVETGLTATTDKDGYYIFDDLDPYEKYRITEITPEDYIDGLDAVGSLSGVADNPGDMISEIPLGANEHGTHYDFGELKTGSLSGHVYEDDNCDGHYQTTEKGIPNIELTLWVWDDTTSQYVKTGITKMTDANGYYEFTDLMPFKEYRITEKQPPESQYFEGKDEAGSLGGVALSPRENTLTDILVGFDQHGVGYNFAERLPASIGGYVYEDLNDNGVKETSENGIKDVELTLFKWNDEKNMYETTGRTVKTDSNGYYNFDHLDPCREYAVREKQPEEYLDGKDTPGDSGSNGENDEIVGIDPAPGKEDKNNNFGEIPKSSLSGYVYEDLNDNGIKETGENGVNGVLLTLYRWNPVTKTYDTTGRTTKTDSSGHYSFNNLDPREKYAVRETQPDNYIDGKDTPGPDGGSVAENDYIVDIAPTVGKDAPDNNFGELPTSKVSGYVYEDVNNNGAKESGENGIKDVSVALYIWNPATDTYTLTGKTCKTDSNGYYHFDDLDPTLIYAVREAQPDGYIDGKDTPGPDGGKVDENDFIITISPKPGKEAGNNNFGELRPSSISGYVFQDGDTIHLYPTDPDPTVAPPTWNGKFADGAKRISGVTLVLADAKGNPLKDSDGNVIKVRSDENGYFEFTMLPEGTYSVIEEQPTGYLDGIDTPGTAGGDAVNVYDTETIEALKKAGVSVDSFHNDVIIGIQLGYAQDSIMNNFSEVEVIRDLVPPSPNPVIPPSIPFYVPDRPYNAGGGYMGHYNYTPTPPSASPGANVGGGGIPTPEYTWHLSVINGGTPRGQESVDVADVQTQTFVASSAIYKNVSWKPMVMKHGKWIIRDKDGNAIEQFTFGLENGKPVYGDFNGDGITEIAIYHDGFWYIDMNGNGIWDEEDMIAQLGTITDQPVIGDWDGDGKADIGIFGPQWEGDDAVIKNDPGLPSDLNTRRVSRPKNVPLSTDETNTQFRAMQHTAQGKVRLDVIDHVFQYGGEGDTAISGCFAGDGVTNIGVYRNGDWYIDRNGDGRWERGVDLLLEGIGRDGEIPVVGDFNGDGIDEIGMYKDGRWRLDTTGDFVLDTEIRFGEPGDLPVVGDFTGDGYSQLGVYREVGPSRMFTRDLNKFPSPSDPSPLYANEFQDDAAPIEMQTETIHGALPGDSSNRTERTQHTPHSSDNVE